MSEWVIPVEQKTGVPLALATRFDIPRNLKTKPGEHDWHHAVYPKAKFVSPSGKALRGARVQYADYDEHRTYHYYFDEYMAEQWKSPKTKLDRFGTVVLLAAGYIPETAIRSRRQGPEYVQLSEHKRELMWRRGLIRVENEKAVMDFLQEMVLSQPMDIDDIAVQEFVCSSDSQLQLRRGNELLAIAAESATEPMREHYREAYIGRLIIPGQPAEPADCILTNPTMLGSEKRRRHTRTAMRLNLANTMGVELKDVA